MAEEPQQLRSNGEARKAGARAIWGAIATLKTLVMTAGTEGN